MMGRNYQQYPDDTKCAGTEDRQNCREQGYAHAAHGRSGDFIEGRNTSEKDGVGKTYLTVCDDLRIVREDPQTGISCQIHDKTYELRNYQGGKKTDPQDLLATVVLTGRVVLTDKCSGRLIEGYNDKGLATWYKSCVKLTSNGYVFSLQEIKTSKKKLAYLHAWKLNTYKK